jgi:hypothetical protein
VAKVAAKLRQNSGKSRGKIVAKKRLMLAVICPENLSAKFDNSLRQYRGKNSAGRGKLAVN